MTKTPKKEHVRTWTWSYRLPRLNGRVMGREREKRENEEEKGEEKDRHRQEGDTKK